MTLLAEQYDFLAASSARFDAGFEHEWKRLAVTLRVLLHDSPKSHSLLDQLVPQAHVDHSGFKLGSWISSKRQARRKGVLSAARIAELDALDMVWDTRKTT